VKNTGRKGAWIRISVESAIRLAEGVTGFVDLSLIEFNIDTTHWILQDGYYYYTEILQAGATTEPLFTEVSFASDMSNMYQKSKATVKVTAHATQSANNGETVFEAAGWPSAE
jgi:hypothetical protein